MVLFWVGYIFSCLSWDTTFAKSNDENISSFAENIHIKDLQWKEDQEKTDDGVERSVAERAIWWWNKLVGNNDSTSSLVVNLPEVGGDITLWDEVASWYEDTSTTNGAWTNMQLWFANSYILPSVYQDISTSSYQEAITILYSNGIIQPNNKFYPHNYVRVSDFIRVVMDAYRVQLWYEPSSLVGLTTNFYFSDASFDSEVMKRVNSAYELWFLQSFALKDAEWKLRLDAFITPQEAKDILKEIKNKNIILPKIREGATHIWHQFVVKCDRRDDLAAYLDSKGIATIIHYPIPPHLSEAYAYLGVKEGSLPITERYAKTVLSIPLYNGMTREEQDYVIGALNCYEWFSKGFGKVHIAGSNIPAVSFSGSSGNL